MRASAEEGLPPNEYIGVAIDGDHIAFAFVQNDEITHGPLMPLSEASVSLVVKSLKSAKRKIITAENLIEDFGHFSSIGTKIMQLLYNSLVSEATSPQNTKVKMLFEEWRTLFGQVAGLSSSQCLSIQRSVKFKLFGDESLRIPALLYVVHTYNSIVIKLLAAEVIGSHGLTAYTDFCAQTASLLTDDEMLDQLEEQVEEGELFSSARITGFVEEAIFSWYLDVSRITNELPSVLRDMLVSIALYRTDYLDGARTNDILKNFYQNLVPEILRKSLGEFYTPDWLVELALGELDIHDWSSKRCLDPTCGSGSFLIAVIRRIKQKATEIGLSPKDTLDLIQRNVWGFDLNPLAVQTSRVNYLISIADLLDKTRGAQIEIPVLLADAVYSPSPSSNKKEGLVEYRIGSSQANLVFRLPQSVAFVRERLEHLFNLFEESILEEVSPNEVLSLALKQKLVTENESEEFQDELQDTYSQVLDLHKSNWNGIWFRIAQNFFWSSVAGYFDVVMGNPPWVRWSSLPDEYRERIKPTCEKYDIFSKTPHYGGNELDISGMITYTAADKWLKDSGILCFLLTQTHFQSPSSAGFRLFSIDLEYSLPPLKIIDLKALKPFPDAANKTSLVLFQKRARHKINYPIEYNIWLAKEEFTRAIPIYSTKEEVLNRVQIQRWEANPVGEAGSPWAILPPGRFGDLERLSRPSEWVRGRKGITADLNGVFFVEITDTNKEEGLVEICTRPEAGRHNIGSKRKVWIEPDLLYPLMKGSSDFSAYKVHLKRELYVFVPNSGIVKTAYEQAEERLNNTLPLTRKYFRSYSSLLKNRSTYKRRMAKAPFYCIYNVGAYTFAPYKVVWAEQSGTFKAAVVSNAQVPLIGKRPYVPDHKIFWLNRCFRELAQQVA